MWGCSAEQLLLLLLLWGSGQHQAQHILLLLPSQGLCEDLQAAVHRKLCSEMINSQMGPAQEYLPCKHAVTRARFACLICCSWERWDCFSALQGECDGSTCLLRLIFSESFCSAGSAQRKGCAFSPRRHLQCPALRPSEADVVVMLKSIWGLSDPKKRRWEGNLPACSSISAH